MFQGQLCQTCLDLLSKASCHDKMSLDYSWLLTVLPALKKDYKTSYGHSAISYGHCYWQFMLDATNQSQSLC